MGFEDICRVFLASGQVSVQQWGVPQVTAIDRMGSIQVWEDVNQPIDLGAITFFWGIPQGHAVHRTEYMMFLFCWLQDCRIEVYNPLYTYC